MVIYRNHSSTIFLTPRKRFWFKKNKFIKAKIYRKVTNFRIFCGLVMSQITQHVSLKYNGPLIKNKIIFGNHFYRLAFITQGVHSRRGTFSCCFFLYRFWTHLKYVSKWNFPMSFVQILSPVFPKYTSD